jgi:hypothetical protein
MKKVITLNENEYNKLVKTREDLKKEVKEEYENEIRKPAIAGAIFLLFINLFGYKFLLSVYSDLPIFATVTIIIVLIFYILSIISCYAVLRKRFSKNK